MADGDCIMTVKVTVHFAVPDSERADPNYCRDRLTEGSNINKSLVTLGIVISALGKRHLLWHGLQFLRLTGRACHTHSSELPDVEQLSEHQQRDL